MCDLGDDGVVQDVRDISVIVGRVRAGEGRVGCDVDAVLLVPVDVLGLLEVGVESA